VNDLSADTPPDWPFGIAPAVLSKLLLCFERTPGIEKVWLYGSRARGDFRRESDIDLAVEWQGRDETSMSRLKSEIDALGLIYRTDLLSLDDALDTALRTRIERDRRVFWEPRRKAADIELIGGTNLKPFQTQVLSTLARYLDELKTQESAWVRTAEALKGVDDAQEWLRDAADFPKKAWQKLKQQSLLPTAFSDHEYSSRFDGAGRPIPNVCLKVPTGGGKTLLAAASVARVFGSYLNRHSGLVLWVVPNDAIYKQTKKALADRDHPYRQMLNVAGAGRVKILEKTSPLTRIDIDSHLCVMLLMLQSAARQSKETLKFFRDRGNVLGFLPRDDDMPAHLELLQNVPNLDAYAPWGASTAEAQAQLGSVVKSSLGNVMRLIRPMVVIDEGHHAYTENALSTLDGFNPCFMLELSATPRVPSAKAKGPSGSNILVDVRGTDLDEAEMIKLPIKVEVRPWSDWQSCLATSVAQLDALAREAEILQAETARYIRPILLVQVERTGADLRDAGFIHAEDAKTYLLQLGFSERQIAVKTSEKDDLKQPENIDLLSPTCEVRAIITKQALQEGWDCPFAYVLCALAAGRNPAAMTQLVGRILRQPHVAKTRKAALDACYVLCHDAETTAVVNSVKKSLESEGMADLAVEVSGPAGTSAASRPVSLRRRDAFQPLQLFLPRVTWVEGPAHRRELVYDSDILAHLDWHRFDAELLTADWAPNQEHRQVRRFEMGLDKFNELPSEYGTARVDRSRLVRGLLDLAPNAWLVWDWVVQVLKQLGDRGFDEPTIARSASSLLERLRIDVESQRDRLAEALFEHFVALGRIEFSLRADATDYALPQTAEVSLTGQPQSLLRRDARPVEKSLLEPALHTPDMNEFEASFAAYLDEKAALRWWHRNVAKTQYGLQGWKRSKVYPDFVFAYAPGANAGRMVLLETKGLHLAGSADTGYKQALLNRLSAAFSDRRMERAGELELKSGESTSLVCDILFDAAWRGSLEARYFSDPDSR